MLVTVRGSTLQSRSYILEQDFIVERFCHELHCACSQSLHSHFCVAMCGDEDGRNAAVSLSFFLTSCLVLAAAPGGFAQADQPTAQPTVQAAQQTREQLQQLVAPIALYSDALVAQVLAAATYPEQIVEADRWMQQHTDFKGEQLGQEVDKQPWDPSVKALAEFPSVLANMDKNLSWTSSLGDAYVNQQQDVMNAVQVMRERAEKSGNLKSTSQEKVTNQGQTIVIEQPTLRLFTCRNMILGSCMDRLSWLGRAGIRTPGSTFRDQVWFLALASSRLCLAALVGDGITGDLTGTTAISFTTTTATFPTAESSPIATTSIADAQASIMPAGFVVEADFRAEARAGVGVSVELPSRMDLWRHTPSLVPIPAHSAASTMEEPPEDFRLAGDRASAEVSTEAGDFTEAEVTGNSDPLLQS